MFVHIYLALKLFKLFKKPGIRKLKPLHSSIKLFSIGVPERASLYFETILQILFVLLAAGFLIF